VTRPFGRYPTIAEGETVRQCPLTPNWEALGTIWCLQTCAGKEPGDLTLGRGGQAANPGEGRRGEPFDRPDLDAWVARMIAEADLHLHLRIFVSWIRTLFEKGAPILRATMAARSEPDVAAMAERGDENRRFGTTQLTQMWSRKGVLRKGLEPADAAERLWLTSVEQYLLATDRLGWSPGQYEKWLGDLLDLELFEPHAPQSFAREPSTS